MTERLQKYVILLMLGGPILQAAPFHMASLPFYDSANPHVYFHQARVSESRALSWHTTSLKYLAQEWRLLFSLIF